MLMPSSHRHRLDNHWGWLQGSTHTHQKHGFIISVQMLNMSWPKVQAETSISHCEEKRLPKAKRPARQVLPIFPECLEEIC